MNLRKEIQHIYEEAIRVASFSLSLAMCDFLDPRSIWDKLSFPRLLDNNLISSDFFDEDVPCLSDMQFSRCRIYLRRGGALARIKAAPTRSRGSDRTDFSEHN